LRSFETFVRSNLWIALGAPALIGVSCLEWESAHPIGLGLAAFFFTVLSYNLQRVVRELRGDPLIGENAPDPFPMRTSLILILLSGLGALISLFTLNTGTLLGLLPPALISLTYALPIFSGKGLRDLPGIKTLLIALSWAYLTVIVPALELGIPLNLDLGVLFLERSLFVFAITIPFDIRDFHVDHPEERNLPRSFGIRTAKGIALALLIFFAISLMLRHRAGELPIALGLGYLCSIAVTAPLIAGSTPNRHRLYYEGALDGTMLLMGVLLASFERLL
jgi:4-hydroxybenzoate polyprenyltransferase